MKNILCFLGFIFLSSAICAQEEGKSFIPKKRLTKEDGLILNINLDNWLQAPDSVEIKRFRSRGVDFNLMHDIPLGGHFSFALGIGFGSQNIFSNASISYDSAGATTYLTPIASGISYDKNKLVTTYFDVPAELRFRTKPNSKGDRFKIAAGFKIGWLVNSHTKYEDGAGKMKVYNISNVTEMHYGVSARISFGKVGFCGYYSLTPFFEEGKGAELIPYSVGIAITPW
jgi:hypothetical protein